MTGRACIDNKYECGRDDPAAADPVSSGTHRRARGAWEAGDIYFSDYFVLLSHPRHLLGWGKEVEKPLNVLEVECASGPVSRFRNLHRPMPMMREAAGGEYG